MHVYVERNLAVLNVPQCILLPYHLVFMYSLKYLFFLLFSFSLTSTFKDIVIIIIVISLTVSTFAGRKVGREKRVERQGGGEERWRQRSNFLCKKNIYISCLIALSAIYNMLLCWAEPLFTYLLYVSICLCFWVGVLQKKGPKT